MESIGAEKREVEYDFYEIQNYTQKINFEWCVTLKINFMGLRQPVGGGHLWSRHAEVFHCCPVSEKDRLTLIQVVVF